MNSPTEPASPTFSTPSTESPTPEETNFQLSQNAPQLAHLTTQITAGLSNSGVTGNVSAGNIGASPISPSGGGPAAVAGSSSKRRQPHGISFRDRDPKLRRREPRGPGLSMGYWESQGGKESVKKDKDDFVDTQIVERLRKEIGDPFLEQEP